MATKQKLKKALALALTFILVVGMTPTQAMAALALDTAYEWF